LLDWIFGDGVRTKSKHGTVAQSPPGAKAPGSANKGDTKPAFGGQSLLEFFHMI
jgi:hypothetical protein